MSYILESIKQAERERKLGQDAPSISIEYTSEHVGDIEHNKFQWALLALGLVVTALIVWGATNYFANKDRQYIEELSANESNNEAPIEDEKRNIAMVPVKTLHSSNLKSVKLITDEEEPVVVSPQVEKPKPVIKQKSIKLNNDEADSVKPKNAVADKVVTESKISDDSDKQVLASIYSDMAKLSKPNSTSENASALANETEENLVQIETASYIAPETLTVAKLKREDITKPAEMPASVPEFKQQHEQAVDSGVPSFGELPYDIQVQIPEFNVSVHMFHADPTQRRIRINGQMYTQGKSLQQDLALVEITRYGAVFDYQGHLFRLNVR